MSRLVIYKNRISESANALADAIPNTRKISPDSEYNPRPTDIILNWGTTDTPEWGNRLNGARVLNHWDRLAVSTNKLRTFQSLRAANVRVPDFSTNIEDARAWITAGNVVIARQILNGSQGDGIIVCKTMAELNAAPNVRLYVKYFKASREMRVFVCGGVVIDFCQKKKRTDFEGPKNVYVRNTVNGYIMARENVDLPDVVRNQCVAATQALGLDLAAVDVRYNPEIGGLDGLVILELNSSPGLSEGGTSLDSLSRAINSFLTSAPIQEKVNPATPHPNVFIPPERPQNADIPRPAVINIPRQDTPTKGAAQYNLSEFQNIEVQSTPTCTKIYGRIPGFNKKILLLHTEGNTSRWIGDHLSE